MLESARFPTLEPNEGRPREEQEQEHMPPHEVKARFQASAFRCNLYCYTEELQAALRPIFQHYCGFGEKDNYTYMSRAQFLKFARVGLALIPGGCLHGPYRLSSMACVFGVPALLRLCTPGCDSVARKDHTGCHRLNRISDCKE